MSKYIFRRILSIIPTILIIVFAIFFILDLTPGTPGRVILGVTATEEQVKNLDEALGYNRPVVVRYVDYLVHAVQGDFGNSYVSQQPVFDILAPKFPTTLKLALLAVAFSALIGIPLGIISSLKPNSIIDNILTTLALFFASVPSFWLGLMFMLIFSLTLGLLWLKFVIQYMLCTQDKLLSIQMYMKYLKIHAILIQKD